jgi:hypothetical protein
VNNAATSLTPLITSLPLSALNPYTESFEVVSNNENYDSDANRFLSVTPEQGNVQETVQQGYGENEQLPNSQEKKEIEYDENDFLPDSQENFQQVNGAGKLPGSQGKNQLGNGHKSTLPNSQENFQHSFGPVQLPSNQDEFILENSGGNGHLLDTTRRKGKGSAVPAFHKGICNTVHCYFRLVSAL